MHIIIFGFKMFFLIVCAIRIHDIMLLFLISFIFKESLLSCFGAVLASKASSLKVSKALVTS